MKIKIEYYKDYNQNTTKNDIYVTGLSSIIKSYNIIKKYENEVTMVDIVFEITHNIKLIFLLEEKNSESLSSYLDLLNSATKLCGEKFAIYYNPINTFYEWTNTLYPISDIKEWRYYIKSRNNRPASKSYLFYIQFIK